MSGTRGADAAPDTLRIEVVYALPDRQSRIELELPVGATVADALAAVADREPFAGLELAALPVGIYGESVARGHALADHDRVEIYRPLLLEPGEARRRRSRAQARRDQAGSATGSSGVSGSDAGVGV